MLQNANNHTTKKTFTLLVFMMLCTTPFSQTVLFDPSEKYIGASYGINNSMVMFNPTVEQNTVFLGTSSGVAFRYITENHAGLQIELKYSQRGWNEANGEYTRRINYIEFPFLTHIYWGNNHRFIVNLGPKLSYLLNESVIKNTTTNSTSEQHLKSVYSPFEYGAAVGLGYNLHTKKAGVFEIEARGYYGLSNIFADSKSDYFSTSNYLNVSINLAWYLQLTGRK